jgi:hypothetical protein
MTELHEYDLDVIVISRYRLTRTSAASASDAIARADIRLQLCDLTAELGDPMEVQYEIGSVFESASPGSEVKPLNVG